MVILKKIVSAVFFSLLILADVILILAVWFIITVTIKVPVPKNNAIVDLKRKKITETFYTINNNWIKKSDTGLWEMYVTGDGFERGVIEGKLNKELAEKQEIAFIDQLKKIVPSQAMLQYLKFFIAFFNRNIDKYVIQEYKDEIYGESLSASEKFDFIAPGYYRMLNYHAAHDIGHAVQDKNMLVGCTSFGVWGNKSQDNTLLIGRNFDFYVGAAFAENKVINFVNPKTGYKLMMISWAGMIGTVSGMNEKGLTVTINAAKSEIPTSAATPISLVAREILQYAANIEQAFHIAKKRKVFISESIMIGSLRDNHAAIIEKTPSQTALYETHTPGQIVCSNHYQSDALKNSDTNNDNIKRSSSGYRFNHLTQLLNQHIKIDAVTAAAILRNQTGMNNKNIGIGNEKALNQLIAHHSVIFKPAALQMWVSTDPFQLGRFICYDLNKVFNTSPTVTSATVLYEKQLTIPADSFLYSRQYKKLMAYRKAREMFQYAHKHKLTIALTETTKNNFINCNPEYFETYFVLGNFYQDQQKKQQALDCYNMALSKEITTMQDKEAIEKEIILLQKK